MMVGKVDGWMMVDQQMDTGERMDWWVGGGMDSMGPWMDRWMGPGWTDVG